MKRVILLGGTLLLLATFGNAQAQSYSFVDSVLTFKECWLQYSYTLFSEWPEPRNTEEARVLGTVDEARSPFGDISPDSLEVTYVISQLTYDYSYAWDGYQSGGYGFNFKDGILRLYSDASPDADVSNPATYADGDLLLEGIIHSYTFENCQGKCKVAGLHYGNIAFTGGTLFSRLDPGDEWRILQTWDLGEPYLSADSLSQFPSHGVLQRFTPVEARSATWGRMKSRFQGH